MASTYLTRTNGSTSSTLTKGTFSAWVKRSNPSTEQTLFTGNNSGNTYRDFIRFEANSQFRVRAENGQFNLETTAKYRDVNAWYHFVAEIDTTLATSTDRVKIYVNGERVTAFNTPTYPSQNYTLTGWSNNTLQTVGRDGKDNNTPFDGSMAHVHWIDGTAYDASAFGQTDAASGIWKPIISPSVTYGTNGFFLKFANSGSLGTDSSGNGNNFTVNGTGTQTLDTPSNVFATLNPLYLQNDSLVFSNGNLTASKPSGVGTGSYFGTLGVNKGKWYWEMKASNLGGSSSWVGVGQMTTLQSSNYPGNDAYCVAAASSEATLRYNGSNVSSGTYSINSWTANDIVQIALDMDNSKVYWGINNTWQNSGNPSSGTGGYTNATIFNGDYLLPVASLYQSGGVYHYNFGNGYFGTTAVASGNADGAGYGIFEYAPPTGYYALCTKNINTYG